MTRLQKIREYQGVDIYVTYDGMFEATVQVDGIKETISKKTMGEMFEPIKAVVKKTFKRIDVILDNGEPGAITSCVDSKQFRLTGPSRYSDKVSSSHWNPQYSTPRVYEKTPHNEEVAAKLQELVKERAIIESKMLELNKQLEGRITSATRVMELQEAL